MSKVCLAAALWAVFVSGVMPYEGCVVRYGRRGCYNRILTGVLAICDGRGEEEKFPHNLPQDTVYMSLTNFRFGQLTKGDFAPFKTIECLTIKDSRVTGIDYDTFAEMESLHELVLSGTMLNNGDLGFVGHPNFKADVLAVTESKTLTTININATTTLHQLKIVDFQGNRIEHISPSFLLELRNVEKLDFSSNRLSVLEWTHLHKMTELNKLFLASNRFQAIPQSMFSTFFAVKELSLANNPLHCNCKLKWLKEFYDYAIDKTLDVSQVACASPTSFSILSASTRDFTCSSPSSPKIVWTLLPDGRFEVNCSSQGDPAPHLNFIFPDDRTIITPPSKDLSQVNSTTPQVITHEGLITCTAENSEGRGSTKQKLLHPRVYI